MEKLARRARGASRRVVNVSPILSPPVPPTHSHVRPIAPHGARFVPSNTRLFTRFPRKTPNPREFLRKNFPSVQTTPRQTNRQKRRKRTHERASNPFPFTCVDSVVILEEQAMRC